MTKSQAVLTAVNWWAIKINESKSHSNGDNSPASIFACMFADMMQEQITELQLVEFRAELAKLIERQIAREIEMCRYRVDVYLGCDYDPCAMLSDAAEHAGISKSNFPFKTNMLIESVDSGKDYTVRVSDGYAQPYVKLHPTNEEK